MSDSRKISQPTPDQALPIAGQAADGTLAYLTLDGSGNLNVTGGGGGGGAATIADGADVTQGAIADAGVVGNNAGTVSAKLRGINKALAGTLTVANGGTFAVQAVSAGDVAADSADSGNPVKVGGKAVTALPTAVTANDRANLLTDVYGRPFVRTGTQGPSGGYSHHQHNPAANTKATITKASAGAGVRNVCTSLTVSMGATASAPAAVQLTVALIDGSAGGTTYLWGPTVVSLPATAGATVAFVLGNTWKPGTAATAMTLEFSAAGGANTIQSVEFDATTVAE